VGANCLDLDWGPLHLNFGSILTEDIDSGYSNRWDGSFFLFYSLVRVILLQLHMPQPIVILNHIGIATELGNTQLDKLFCLLGITRGISEKVPDQGVNVQFFNLSGTAPHLELLEVQDPEGSVSKFIKKRGAGIHHLSFSVQTGKLDSLIETLKTEGYRFTYPAPKLGAQNMRINFIHPATAGGVLIELMELGG